MTFEEARSLISGVAFGGAFGGIRMSLQGNSALLGLRADTATMVAVLEASWTVPCRDDPATTVNLSRCTGVDREELSRMEKWECLAWVYREFRSLVDHEALEAFRYDGRRVFDPHDKPRGGTSAILRGVFA